MYLVYAKDDNECCNRWLFWRWDEGWSDIDEATLYDYELPPYILEGSLLPVEDKEEASVAEAILDMQEVLLEHADTNLASPAGRQAMARWLASKLNSEARLVGARTYRMQVVSNKELKDES